MTNPFSLQGKVALVTGANTGLGQGIALALAEAGADIAAAGIAPPTETEAMVTALGRRFVAIQANLSSLEPIDRIVQQRGTEWSQIRVGETVGWMMNEFLRFGTTGTGTGTGGESGGVGTGTVVSDNGLRVWLRTTPNGKRIQLYRPGTAVTILSYGGEWHYISIGGVRGYMMSRYISVTPAPAPSSKMVEAVSVNYPSPVVDDVLQASVTPSDATVTYSWKVKRKPKA